MALKNNMSFDLYSQLQAALNPKSVYGIDIRYQIENYIQLIIDELVKFFKPEHQNLFIMTMKSELNKTVQRTDITDATKMAIIKRTLYEQIYPQIKKYLLHEFNVVGELQIDNSSELQKQLAESINKLVSDDNKISAIKEEEFEEPEVRLEMYQEEQLKRIRNIAQENARKKAQEQREREQRAAEQQLLPGGFVQYGP